MTLIVGLRGADGVVLASDSQGTREGLRQPTTKLFKASCGMVWGTAGPLAGAQALYAEFERLNLSANPRREEAKRAIGAAMKAAAAALVAPRQSGEEEWFEGLFAWYDTHDRRHYLLLARHDGHAEFMRPYGAVGSSRRLGLFGFSRSAFMNYETLELETTKMLTYMVAEDAIEASAKGVDGPIQMAAVSAGTTAVLKDGELQPVKETAAAFQLHQLDFVKRATADKRPGTGLVPGGRGS